MAVERVGAKLIKAAERAVPTSELTQLYEGYMEILNQRGRTRPSPSGVLERAFSKFFPAARIIDKKYSQEVAIGERSLHIDVQHKKKGFFPALVQIRIGGIAGKGQPDTLFLTSDGEIGWPSRTPVFGHTPSRDKLNPFIEALELLQSRGASSE